MRRKLIPWLLCDGPLEMLDEWLQGFDLPLAGDEEPYRWLLAALEEPFGARDLRERLAKRLSEYIHQERWNKPSSQLRQERSARNAFSLAEKLHEPEILGDSVWIAQNGPARFRWRAATIPGPNTQ